MENLQNILCAVGGFAFGTLGAYINARVSRKGINDTTLLAIMGTNAIRMLIDIVTLVIAFLVSRHFDLPVTLTIVAVALGLTIFGMIFLKKLTNQILKEGNGPKDGGE